MTPSPPPSSPWAAGFRAVVRTVRVVGHVLHGLWTLRTAFPRLNPVQRHRAVQAWSVDMLRHMGVALVVQGERPVCGPLLVVANHLSWLDILVLNAACPSRFVSKADVRRWPVLGRLVEGAGTLFIERESRRDAMRVVHHMAESLRAGDVVTVFPEGTTGTGHGLLPFHANLFQAAIAVQAAVQPVALAYRCPHTGAPSDAPVYVGNTTLIASIWRTLCAPGVQAQVHYLPPDTAAGRDRRAWAQAMQQCIAAALAAPGASPAGEALSAAPSPPPPSAGPANG